MPGAKEVGLVHAEWCGHCKNLLPMWESFKQNNVKGGKYGDANVETYEEKEDKDLIEEKGIKVGGFPHFYSIDQGGKVSAHEAVDRTEGGIKKWMDSVLGGEEKTEEKKESFSVMGMFGGKKKRKTAKKAKKAKKSKKSKRKTAKKAKKSKKTKKRKLFGLF